MPTYAYACTACDHRFEAQQSFTDASLTECPQCHGQLRKLFNSVGIVFKGSGFYRTDSRGTKSDTSPSSESSSSSSSGDSSSKSESGSSSAKSDSGSSGSSGSSSSSGSSGSSGSSSPGSKPAKTPAA